MAYQPKCPICMREVPFTIKDEEFVISVKNEEFLITGKRAFCTIDGEELYYPKFDIENKEQAFQLSISGVDYVRLQYGPVPN